MPERRQTQRAAQLRRYGEQYEDLKRELTSCGYILQGSVTERWIECGKPNCHCHTDRQARHGPYHQWSWKTRGRTASVYLDEEQAMLCKKWVKNNRHIERTLQRMRALSLRAARLHEIPRK
jgi:hypothetical protein